MRTLPEQPETEPGDNNVAANEKPNPVSDEPSQASLKESPSDAKKPAEHPHLQTTLPVEHGGQKGPEPTRYGDWEKNGRCTDF